MRQPSSGRILAIVLVFPFLTACGSAGAGNGAGGGTGNDPGTYYSTWIGGERESPGYRRVSFGENFFSRPGTIYMSPNGSDDGDGSRENPYESLWVASEIAAPGEMVLLLPGRYEHGLTLNGSGEELVPVTTGVSVEGGKVFFPSGTDVSGIQVNDGDFVYVYRSRYSNNGVHQITGVGNSGGIPYVETGAVFYPEDGVNGDDLSLSAAVGRPLVIAPAHTGTVEIGSSFYIEKHAWTLITGLHVKDSVESFNIQKGGSYHVFYNNRIENLSDMNGMQVGLSTADSPSLYNVLANNVIINPQVEGIYIGAGGQGAENNYTDFSHLLGNDITMTNGESLENGIDLKEDNRGSVVEGNYLHHFDLMTSGNGAVDIRERHDGVLFYRNRFENIRAKKSDEKMYQPYLLTHDARGTEVFNNEFILSQGFDGRGVHGWSSKLKTSHGEVSFYNNTLWGDFGSAVMVDNTGGALTVANNALSVPRPAVVYKFGAAVSASHNAYLSVAPPDARNWAETADPDGTPETNPLVAEDFSFVSPNDPTPSSSSPLVGQADQSHAPALDFIDQVRPDSASIGSREAR